MSIAKKCGVKILTTNNMPLGELLVEINVISQKQLDKAFEVQKTSEGKSLGDVLIDLGYITEKQYMKALEYRFRIPFVDLATMEIPSELSNVLSPDTAKQYTIVPVELKDNKLTIAVSDPMNFQAFDDVKLQTKLDVKTVLATPTDIKSAIIKLYEQTQTDEAMEDLNNEYTIEDVEKLSEEVNNNVDSAPVVRLVNLIITQAINSRASDVHIEPLENIVRVRFRIDGVLYEQLTIKKAAYPAIVTRIKIMGNMNIAEKRIPQDGRYQTTFNGTTIDLRLSILPTVNGEKVVLRILGGKGVALERKQLGFNEKNSKMFDRILQNPNGIILVSGPTGSGKSTTLYTVLKEINKPETNIITVEDPVEYRMEGINQVQVNPKAGLTFASGLRSILRQDPDVIMIGEIRDSETAEIAVRASITGHLVLSTIHTNDSASTITRLVDMGIEPYLVSASVVGVIAQRLVRRICPKCKIERDMTDAEMELINIHTPMKVYKGKGCKNCNNTGYKGRIAIHEVLVMNKEICEAIENKETTERLREIAKANGTESLRESCFELVKSGITTVDELVKVTYSND